jgi:hypothetical protein
MKKPRTFKISAVISNELTECPSCGVSFQDIARYPYDYDEEGINPPRCTVCKAPLYNVTTGVFYVMGGEVFTRATRGLM